MSDFREDSKKCWTSSTSVEHINAGSLQRIADAMELSCKNREKLERDYANMRRWRDEAKACSERLARSNAALRGVINRMKKARCSTADPVDQHSDDAAVDAFAAAMKAKLAEARTKGRGGWQDKADCPQQRLSDMLRAHVDKGDPRDVANFCMFLHQRGEAILPAEPVAQGEADELISAYDEAVRRQRESGFQPPAAQQAARACVEHNRNRLRKVLAGQPRAALRENGNGPDRVLNGETP